MLTQLTPPLPLDTPKGPGLAFAVIDYGPDFNLLWVVFDDATGECWTWPNSKIRAVKNITMGRRTHEITGGRLAELNANPLNGKH
jgi:hypothetical protein